MKNLIGKQAKGFKFEGGPTFSTIMEKYVDVIGTIRRNHYNSYCSIEFEDDWFWYPYPEILEHLVEPEPEFTLDEILLQIKNLKP